MNKLEIVVLSLLATALLGCSNGEENAAPDKSNQTLQVITFMLVVVMVLLQIVYIVFRLRQSNKPKKSAVEKDPENYTTPQSQSPEYRDKNIFNQINNLASTLNSYRDELNELSAFREQIPEMYRKICEIKQSLEKTNNSPESSIQQRTKPFPQKTQDNEYKKKYYVRLPKGDVFINATMDHFLGAKFCIETKDNQRGIFQPLDLKELKSTENTRCALQPTSSSCKLNEANDMKIVTEGKVRFEQAENRWRIETPCIVELTR